MKTFIKSVFLFWLLSLLAILSFGCSSSKTSDIVDEKNPMIRGMKLVEVGGCNDCHTPKIVEGNKIEVDFKRLLSGHPEDAEVPKYDSYGLGSSKQLIINDQHTVFIGNWGVSFASNLTPDKETGIGMWTEKLFVDKMMSSTHMSPMPVFRLTALTKADFKTIFSYLKSLQPVKNAVPKSIPLSKLRNQ